MAAPPARPPSAAAAPPASAEPAAAARPQVLHAVHECNMFAAVLCGACCRDTQLSCGMSQLPAAAGAPTQRSAASSVACSGGVCAPHPSAKRLLLPVVRRHRLPGRRQRRLSAQRQPGRARAAAPAAAPQPQQPPELGRQPDAGGRHPEAQGTFLHPDAVGSGSHWTLSSAPSSADARTLLNSIDMSASLAIYSRVSPDLCCCASCRGRAPAAPTPASTASPCPPRPRCGRSVLPACLHPAGIPEGKARAVCAQQSSAAMLTPTPC